MPDPLKERSPLQSEIWSTHLSINSGDNTHVSAPSGTGKTTFVHIVYGLRKDYSGAVSLGGDNPSTFGVMRWSRLRQRHLSIVFQDLRLFADLTAWDNLMVKNHLTRHYTEAEIAAMAGRLGITQLLPNKAATLSQGEKQRVAILRALLQPFDLLLLDEPFSHLDADNARAAAELIVEECNKQDGGLLIAQHGDDNHFTYTKRLRL